MNAGVYESVQTKVTLNRVNAPSMPFEWSINPYRGCAHGCSFCYARQFQSYIGLGVDEFQTRIRVKTNAAEALEAQLARMHRKYGGRADRVGRHIGEVTIGTATDPYQPVEAKTRITRSCLQVLAKYGVAVSITTRSPLVMRDLDILSGMDILSVNISMNTLRADIVRKLEPASPLPAKRLEALRKLADGGVRACVFAAPVLPCLTDSAEDLEALIAAARDYGAACAMVSLLRLTPDVKTWYLQTLRQHFPHLVPAYERLFPAANAQRAYADTLKRTADALLAKYGMAWKDDGFAARRAASQASEPEAEQLSFLF